MNSIYTEYANLTDAHKAWLDGCGATHPEGQRVSEYEPIYTRYLMFRDKMFVLTNHKDNLITGDEFCQRVAEILGIEKPTFGDDPWVSNPLNKIYPLSTVSGSKMTDEQHDKLFPGRQNMGEASLTQEDIHTLLGDKVEKTYPHKTYRVLDSLDGIPLDTRIPLSEWIPPFGAELVFVEYDSDVWCKCYLVSIGDGFINGKETGCEEYTVISLDGHWMRIV